jgi:hypothetical protein
MADWKTREREILAAGNYIRKNQWEEKLRRHVEKYLPNLAKELRKTGDFEAYLVVETAAAQDNYNLMTSQGMSADDARQAALADLLPTPPDEVNRPPTWETLGVVGDSLAGQIHYLQSLYPNVT